MPLDLAQLTRRLAQSSPAAESKPYSLEASFQTVLDAEQRVYEICERAGIVLGEDALRLQEPPKTESPLTKEDGQQRASFMHYAPLKEATFWAHLLYSLGMIATSQLYTYLIEEGRKAEAVPGAAAVMVTTTVVSLGYLLIGWNAQHAENRKENP